MDTGRPCYVSMAELLNQGNDGHRAFGGRGQQWNSELMSLDDMKYAVMRRDEFMAIAQFQSEPANAQDVMAVLVSMAMDGRLRHLAGVMVDMRIKASVVGRRKILQAIKTLLTQQVEVVLVDGDGYFVNLLELDQFCTSRDFVDMYMSGIFSDRWSFGVMSGNAMSAGLGVALSTG